MTRALNIDYLKLWQVTPRGPSHDDLAFIFNAVANYFAFDAKESWDIEKPLSFRDAMIQFADALGLMVLPITNQNVSSLNAPLIAREKKSSAAVLLLPTTFAHYEKISRSQEHKRIKKNRLLDDFDCIVMLIPINKTPELINHGDVAKIIKQFFAHKPIAFLSSLLAFFAVAFFSLQMMNVFESESRNRLAVFLFSFSLVILTTILAKNIRFLSLKNYGLTRGLLLHDFYQRLVRTNVQHFAKIHENIIAHFSHAISVAHRRWFFKTVIIFSSATLIFATVMIAFIISKMLTVLVIVITAIFIAISLMIKEKIKPVTDEKIRYENQTSLLLENYEHSLHSIKSLQADKPFLEKIAAIKNSLIDATITKKTIDLFWRASFLVVPVMCALGFALFSTNAVFVAEPFHLAIGLSLAFLFGIALVAISFTVTKMTKLPTDDHALVAMSSWPQPILSMHVEPVNIEGSIELINVSFSYADTGALIFKNCNLLITKKNFYIICGSSGAGKTTLLELLCSQRHPSVGEIVFDGQDARSLNQDSLRRNFGVVFDDSRLFSGSVFDNIMGGRSLPIKSLENLLLSHEIFDRIIDLPMGLETYIFWHGKNVSSLERSLILLLRALVHKPKLLFMDEILISLSPADQEMMLDYLSTLDITRVLTSPFLIERNDCKIIEIHDRDVCARSDTVK